jgi:hypothetical protein
MHGALEKKEKDFFAGEVCPLKFFVEKIKGMYSIISA